MITIWESVKDQNDLFIRCNFFPVNGLSEMRNGFAVVREKVLHELCEFSRIPESTDDSFSPRLRFLLRIVKVRDAQIRPTEEYPSGRGFYLLYRTMFGVNAGVCITNNIFLFRE